MSPPASTLPPLALLRTFEVAARHLSFKRAAAELHVTPAAVSQQIKALEQQLGQPLFLRLTRALALSAAGAALLPEVQAGLALLDGAVRRVQAAGAGAAGDAGVEVIAPPSFAAHWLLPRLPDFHARHPELPLRLTSSPVVVDGGTDGRGLAALLQEAGAAGVADSTSGPVPLAIVFGPGGHAGLREDLLLAPDFLPVCAPSWLAAHALAAPADLRGPELIHDDTIAGSGRRGTPAWGWPQWLAAAGVDAARARGGRHFSNAALAIQAALAGQGLALAARPLVAQALAAGALVAPFRLALAAPYRYQLVGRHETAAHPAVVAFRQWLLAQAGAPPLASDSGLKEPAP